MPAGVVANGVGWSLYGDSLRWQVVFELDLIVDLRHAVSGLGDHMDVLAGLSPGRANRPATHNLFHWAEGRRLAHPEGVSREALVRPQVLRHMHGAVVRLLSVPGRALPRLNRGWEGST